MRQTTSPSASGYGPSFLGGIELRYLLLSINSEMGRGPLPEYISCRVPREDGALLLIRQEATGDGDSTRSWELQQYSPPSWNNTPGFSSLAVVRAKYQHS